MTLDDFDKLNEQFNAELALAANKDERDEILLKYGFDKVGCIQGVDGSGKKYGFDKDRAAQGLAQVTDDEK